MDVIFADGVIACVVPVLLYLSPVLFNKKVDRRTRITPSVVLRVHYRDQLSLVREPVGGVLVAVLP